MPGYWSKIASGNREKRRDIKEIMYKETILKSMIKGVKIINCQENKIK